MRDFNEKKNNIDSITKTIQGDVNKLWSEIYKPEGYEDAQPQQFFSFEFTTLPNKDYEEEKFEEACIKLKGRFRQNVENSLFPHDCTKNVPMDGFALFISQTWDTIRSNKELNLPG